jgi:hypothetical protein
VSQAMAWVLVIGDALNQRSKQGFYDTSLNQSSEKSKVLTYVRKG